jgi:hypothetical protein
LSIAGKNKLYRLFDRGILMPCSYRSGFQTHVFSYVLLISQSSEFVGCILKGLLGDAILALFNSAVDFDRVAPADPFLQFIYGELHAAVSAGNRTIVATVALFVRITACTGIEIGADFVVDLDHKVIDILALKMIRIEFRNLGLKAFRIDNDVLRVLRGRGIRMLAGTR